MALILTWLIFGGHVPLFFHLATSMIQASKVSPDWPHVYASRFVGNTEPQLSGELVATSAGGIVIAGQLTRWDRSSLAEASSQLYK